MPLYCIYFPEISNRPEFTEIKNLDHAYYKNHKPLIAGFASNASNAIAILQHIVEETYDDYVKNSKTEFDYRGSILAQNEIVTKFSRVRSLIEISPKKDEDESSESSAAT